MDDSTTYPWPRYPPIVRAFAGDSTITNLWATGLCLLLRGGAPAEHGSACPRELIPGGPQRSRRRPRQGRVGERLVGPFGRTRWTLDSKATSRSSSPPRRDRCWG